MSQVKRKLQKQVCGQERPLLLLFADISGLICKDDSVKATFRVNNLDRKPVSVEGSYRCF